MPTPIPVATIINGGTLQLGNGASGLDGSLAGNSVVNNSALLYNLYGNQTAGYVISGSGSLTTIGASTLTLSASNTYTGATVISNGTLQLGTGQSGQDGSIASTSGVTNNAALVYNLYGNQTAAYAIGGSGSLTKFGSNSLTLSGSNSYGGGTTLSGGTLVAANNAALGSGAVSLNPSVAATLAFTTAAPAIGSLGSSGAGTASVVLGNTSLSSSTMLSIGAANANSTFSGTISDLSAASAAASGGLTKTGTGTLTLAAANTFTGPTVISGGTLTVANPLALQKSTCLPTNGGLSFAPGVTTATLGGLSGYGNVSLATAAAEPVALSVGNNNQNTLYEGSLSGGSGLTKVGSGTLTLSAAQGYNGPTVVSGGVLKLMAPGVSVQWTTGGSYSLSSGAAAGAVPLANWNVITVPNANTLTTLSTVQDASGNTVGSLSLGFSSSAKDPADGAAEDTPRPSSSC